MTTITALNVRLGMDVSNFSEGANLAKSETTRVAAIMRQSVPASEKYKQGLDLINRAFSEAGKKSKEYANAVAHLEQKHNQATAAIAKTTAATKASTGANNSALASIKGMAAAYVSFQAVTKSLNLANQVEDATIAFEVLTGSAKDGQLLFEQIRKFSAESPVTFSGAAQAAKTMMSFGVAVQDVQKNLQMLSDVTGGNNERFKLLSLAFSQTSAAGRLMGGELRQMTEAGFNPLQQISKTTGESLIELKARMEAGGISAEEVRKAFENATAQGGMFHGMTERLAETVSGKMNIALSDMEKTLADVGKALGPLVVQLLDALTRMKPILEPIVWLIDKISTGLAFILAAVTDLRSMAMLDFDATEINKILDDIEKRNREAADAANQQIQGEIQQKLNGVDAVAAAEKKSADKKWKEELKSADETFKKQLKAMEDAQKAKEEAAKKAAEAWQRELEDARKDAMAFFDEQQKQNEQRRADVAKGPGSGMEVGSAEAVKFAADAVNASIAREAVPNDPAATNRDIAAKTAEILIAQREANAKHERGIRLAEQMLEEMQQNGFRRIR